MSSIHNPNMSGLKIFFARLANNLMWKAFSVIQFAECTLMISTLSQIQFSFHTILITLILIQYDRFSINDIIIKIDNLEQRDSKYAKCQKKVWVVTEEWLVFGMEVGKSFFEYDLVKYDLVLFLTTNLQSAHFLCSRKFKTWILGWILSFKRFVTFQEEPFQIMHKILAKPLIFSLIP